MSRLQGSGSPDSGELKHENGIVQDMISFFFGSFNQVPEKEASLKLKTPAVHADHASAVMGGR